MLEFSNVSFSMDIRPGRAVARRLLAASAATPAHADEGMWTFNNFPAAATVKQLLFGADRRPRKMAGSRRVSRRCGSSNCSASFVSKRRFDPDQSSLRRVLPRAELHAARRASIEDGFIATQTRARRSRCGTQVADVLIEMQDISDRRSRTRHEALDRRRPPNDARKRHADASSNSACEAAANPRRKAANR